MICNKTCYCQLKLNYPDDQEHYTVFEPFLPSLILTGKSGKLVFVRYLISVEPTCCKNHRNRHKESGFLESPVLAY